MLRCALCSLIPWRLTVLLVLWPLGLAAQDPAGPRYVLCTNPVRPPAVPLGGGELRVYAASVAGVPGGGALHGRQRLPLALRAAVLLDGRWGVSLPVVDGRKPNSGHAAHVSYAKCIGGSLPEDTQVVCRLGGPGPEGRRAAGNATASEGRLASFRNKELHHDFVDCPLGARALRWQQPGGAPPRIYMELEVRPVLPQVGADLVGGRSRAVVPLELCRVDRPLLRASFCSQPLFGFKALQEKLPWIVEDWLTYHLNHFGFEHAEIYDVDASFALALEPWVRAGAWHGRTVTYHGKWPATLSETLQAHSRDNPYCTETLAYAHCLTTHRALSRWVALLHAPDEYLVVRKNPSRDVLHAVLEELESELPVGDTIPFLQVNAVSFAWGGPGAEADVAASRGSVIAASRLRNHMPYHHMPLIDPANCICSGPHLCYAEVGDWVPYSGLTTEVRVGLLAVHHYVEMLPELRGRCSTHQGSCEVPDASMSWAVDMLRGL